MSLGISTLLKFKETKRVCNSLEGGLLTIIANLGVSTLTP